jgi:hypothetical protein
VPYDVEEVVRRAYNRAAIGMDEMTSNLYFDQIKTWVSDALGTLGTAIRDHPDDWPMLERKYTAAVEAGTGGFSLMAGSGVPDFGTLLFPVRRIEHSNPLVECAPVRHLYQFFRTQPKGIIWWIITSDATGYRLRTIDIDGVRDSGALDGSSFYVYANFTPTIADIVARPNLQDRLVYEVEKIARAKNDQKFALALLEESKAA